jgi:lantibiotic modifying enzyme
MPLLWVWHDSWYLGAAHGVSGILQTLLSLEPFELTRLDSDLGGASAIGLIQSTVDKLDHYCFPSGNLDSSIHLDHGRRKIRTDRLVQWCHGAPGHVLLLLQAHRVFGQGRQYLDRARQVADGVIWPRGLLRKGVGLCHGIAGNAYTLLELGRYDPSYVRKARYFADFALDHLNELEVLPDRPSSLYEGLAGLCCLLIDLLLPPEEARFPLFC